MGLALWETKQIVSLSVVRSRSDKPVAIHHVTRYVNSIWPNFYEIGFTPEVDVVGALSACDIEASSVSAYAAHMSYCFMCAIAVWFRNAGNLTCHFDMSFLFPTIVEEYEDVPLDCLFRVGFTQLC